MKKVLLVLVLSLTTILGYSQTTVDTSYVVKSKFQPYVSVGVSITNVPTVGDPKPTFSNTSYPSLEVGLYKAYGSYGLSLGVAYGTYSITDTDKSWVEAKITPSIPLGPFNGNVILGVGTYVTGEDKHSFIEYGFGVSKSIVGGLSAGLSYSNWDGYNYVTPSIGYTF